MTVPVVNIAAMAVSALISICVPVCLTVLWNRKTKARISSALLGAVTFILFVYVLENAMHAVMIYGNNSLSQFVNNTPWAFVLYAGFAAGIFEEVGRFATFKLFFKKRSDKAEGVMYGIGHGGIEAILVAGLAMLLNIVFAVLVNKGATESLLNMAGGDTAVAEIINSFAANTAPTYLVSGIERLIAITLHIALSVFVFAAVKQPGKGWMLPLAILLHAAVDCFAMLYRVGTIKSIWTIEIGVMIMTAIIAFFAFRMYRAWKQAPQDGPMPEAEPDIASDGAALEGQDKE